jgi:hypothetical protein
MRQALREPHPLEHAGGSFARRRRSFSADQARHHDVFECREVRQKMVELEHETDRAIAKASQVALALCRDVDSPHEDLTRRRPLESAEQVQERALADPRLTDDRHGLTGTDPEIDPREDAHRPRSVGEFLDQPPRVDVRLPLLSTRRHPSRLTRSE